MNCEELLDFGLFVDVNSRYVLGLIWSTIAWFAYYITLLGVVVVDPGMSELPGPEAVY